MRHQSSGLKLNRQTLRQLTRESSAEIQGGHPTDYISGLNTPNPGSCITIQGTCWGDGCAGPSLGPGGSCPGAGCVTEPNTVCLTDFCH